MEFKAACKKAGQNINETLEEAVKDWIVKQEQSTQPKTTKVLSLKRKYENSAACGDLTLDYDEILSTLPTIANAIETTLENSEWALKHLAKDSKISVNRLKKLLSGDRPSDEEIERLASCLVKFDGSAFDKEELTDICLTEALKQRQLERLKKQKKKSES